MLQQLRRQHVGAAVKFKRCQYLYRYYTRNHLESQSSFWGGLKGVLSKQDNGHFGFQEQTLPKPFQVEGHQNET